MQHFDAISKIRRCWKNEKKLPARSPAPSISGNYLRRVGLDCFVVPHKFDHRSRLRGSHVTNVSSVLRGSETSVKVHRCNEWSVITMRTREMRVAQKKTIPTNTRQKYQEGCGPEARQTRAAISSAHPKPRSSSGHDEGNSSPTIFGKRRIHSHKYDEIEMR